MDNSIYIICISAALALFFFVGNYVGRTVKNIEDYVVAGRNAPTFLVLGTLVASYFASNAFMGEAGFVYNGNLAPIMYVIAGNSLGYLLGAIFFGRYVRRSESLTLPQFFSERFGSRRIRVVCGITVIFGMASYLMSVTQGMGMLFSELMGVDYIVALIIIWFVYTSFTFYGGSRGVIVTDTMMFLVFALVTAFIMVVLGGNLGGWDTIVQKLATFSSKEGLISAHGWIKPGTTEFSSPGQVAIWAVVFGLAWMAMMMIGPWQVGRYLMAKNEHVVLRTASLAGTILIILYIAILFPPTALNLINPDIDVPEKINVWASLHYFPTWLGVLFLTGIISAGLLSCSTFLSLCGFSVSQDIMHPERTTDKLKTARISMLATGGAVLLLSIFNPPALFWLVYFAGTVFCSSWLVVGLMAIWSSKITEKAAFWGIMAGFFGNVIPKLGAKYVGLSLPVWADPVVIGTLLSLVVVLALSKESEVSEEERTYREKLHEIPEELYDVAEQKRTLLIPKLAAAACILTTVFLFFIYWLPYEQAVAATGM